MATGTITLPKSERTENGGYIIGKIVWSSERMEGENASVLNLKLYCRKGNDSITLTKATSGTWTYTIGIESNSFSGSTASGTKILNDWVKIAEKSLRVDHEGDGGSTVMVIGSVTAPSGTSYEGKTTEGTQSISLDTIPGASKIILAESVKLGESCLLKWIPSSSQLHYRILFSLGSFSYATDILSPNTDSEYTYTGYILPYDVANQFPDSKSGTMTAKLSTYADAGCTVFLGADTATFTVTLPLADETVPTVAVSLSPVNDGLSSDFAKLYIQGKSRIQSDFTGSKANYSSTLTGFSQLIGSSYKRIMPPEALLVSDLLSVSGSITVQNFATDSRNFLGEKDMEIQVLPYSLPKLVPATGESSVICQRCDENMKITPSGTNLLIKAGRRYSTVVSDGIQRNFCRMKYRYRAENTESFSSFIPLLEENAPLDEVTACIEGFDAHTSYIVELCVFDDLGGSDRMQVVIPTEFVTVHLAQGGKRIGIFRYTSEEEEPGVYVDGPIHGGAVDNLTPHIRLTATSALPIDLDDLKTPGNYYSPNAENSSFIAHTPCTEGGFGLMVRNTHEECLVQTIYAGSVTYIRQYDGAQWSVFQRLLTADCPEGTYGCFLLEAGEAKGWTYKKYSDGTYWMFGSFTVCASSDGTAYGSLYYSEEFALQTPFPITSAVVSGSCLNWFFLINAGQGSTDSENQVGFRLFRPTAFSSGTYVRVRLTVSGTYV